MASTFSANRLDQQPGSSSHSLIQGSVKVSLHRHDRINYGTLVIKLISSYRLEGGEAKNPIASVTFLSFWYPASILSYFGSWIPVILLAYRSWSYCSRDPKVLEYFSVRNLQLKPNTEKFLLLPLTQDLSRVRELCIRGQTSMSFLQCHKILYNIV